MGCGGVSVSSGLGGGGISGGLPVSGGLGCGGISVSSGLGGGGIGSGLSVKGGLGRVSGSLHSSGLFGDGSVRSGLPGSSSGNGSLFGGGGNVCTSSITSSLRGGGLFGGGSLFSRLYGRLGGGSLRLFCGPLGGSGFLCRHPCRFVGRLICDGGSVGTQLAGRFGGNHATGPLGAGGGGVGQAYYHAIPNRHFDLRQQRQRCQRAEHHRERGCGCQKPFHQGWSFQENRPAPARCRCGRRRGGLRHHQNRSCGVMR